MKTFKKDGRIHFRSDAQFDKKLAVALAAFNKKYSLELEKSDFIRMCVVKFTEDIIAAQASAPYPEHKDAPLSLAAEASAVNAPEAAVKDAAAEEIARQQHLKTEYPTLARRKKEKK